MTSIRTSTLVLALAASLAACAESPVGAPSPNVTPSASPAPSPALAPTAGPHRAPAGPPRAFTDTTGFDPMPESEPGDWLDRFDERYVPFREYVETDPVRADDDRNVLAFVPVGPFTSREREVMDATVELCGIWFDLPTRVLPAMDLPGEDFQRSVGMGTAAPPRVQYHTDWFLQSRLPRNRPEDAVTLVAVTMGDLYPGEGWNFVFGMAMLHRRVGVYSLVRHFADFWGQDDDAEAQRRALLRSLKLVVHESGHTFGLEHCVRYRCVMNGSNSLDESDRQPLHLCPDCLRKLAWNRGLDVNARYDALAALYTRLGLTEEARWVEDRLAVLRTAR